MPRAPRRFRLSLRLSGGAAAILLAASAGAAWAWGASGHRIIGRVAIEALPVEIPAFLRSPQAVDAVGELAREPDRSKGAGQPHDADLDPGHYVDLTEDGHIYLPTGPSLAALPKSRHDYDTALVKAGIDPFKAGYLQYNLLDGYEQLAKDFAYWRIETAILKHRLLPEHRGFVKNDLKLREALIVRDLGVWAHFVGDASQPFHTSIHYNGWGDYPNPEGFTQDKVHGPFESDYVSANVKLADIKAALPAPADCGPTAAACVIAYLNATNAQVAPFFRLQKAGAFAAPTPQGKAFTVERIAAGAAMLRDLTVKAWRDSEKQGVGYKPLITVAQVESGAPIDPKALWNGLYGDD
jgi:hypothetical protein